MSPNESTTSAPIALPPKRERRKHARPGELLEAALHVFVDQGFGAAKVEEIASRAGVSKGTLFLYFASKEELFKAVVRDTIVGQLSQFQAAVDTFQGPTPELMRTMVHAWWQRSHANGSTGIAKLMLSEGKHFPELANFYRTEVIDPARDLIGRLLARGIARGEFRAIHPTYGPYTLLSSMIFLALWHHAPGLSSPQDGPPSAEAYLDTLLDAYLGGVLVRHTQAIPIDN